MLSFLIDLMWCVDLILDSYIKFLSKQLKLHTNPGESQLGVSFFCDLQSTGLPLNMKSLGGGDLKMSQNTLAIIFGVLFGISEALSMIPALKSNGIFQMVLNILKTLAGSGSPKP